MKSENNNNLNGLDTAMSNDEISFPLSAIVGMDDLILGLLLVAREPKLGGVLLTGDKGTAKTTAARSLAKLLGGRPFIDLPLSVTEDRLLGSIDYSKVLKNKDFEYRPGLLPQANGGVLYVDEINLLAPYLTDALLDSQAAGYLNFQRDGLSLKIETKYVLIGSMNPEEGLLRPQLLDRFGLSINVFAPISLDVRTQIVTNRLKFNENPTAFYETYRLEEEKFAKAIHNSIKPEISKEIIKEAGVLSVKAQVQGLRSDIVLVLAARAFAGLMGSREVTLKHLYRIAPFVLNHRCKVDLSEVMRDQQEASHSEDTDHPVEAILNRDTDNKKQRTSRNGADGNDKTELKGGCDDDNDSAVDEIFENSSSNKINNNGQSGGNGDDGLQGHESQFGDSGITGNPKSEEYEKNDEDNSFDKSAYGGNASDNQQVQRINNLLKKAKQRREFSVENSNVRAMGKAKTSYKLDSFNSTVLAGSKLSIIETIFASISDSAKLNADDEITYENLRFVQYENNNEIIVVLILDISKSIGAAKRLDFAKEFVNSVFQSIYQSRIKISLYTFGNDKVEMLCEPTGSVELIKDKLTGIAFEGNTPLHLALEKVLSDAMRLKSENKFPLLFLVTDGKAKVSKQINWEDILILASKFKVNQLMTSIVPIGDISKISGEFLEDLKTAMGAVNI